MLQVGLKKKFCWYLQFDADSLHGFYFADISSSNKQKLKIFIPNGSSWKRGSMQTKQNKIGRGINKADSLSRVRSQQTDWLIDKLTDIVTDQLADC